MLKSPRVTVLMTAYNEEVYIAQAVESILDQTYSDFEFVIIDDGSTDNTLKILEEFAAKDSRIKIIQQKNQGVSAACNNGLKESRGEFIARQDADDVSAEDRLEKQVAFLDSHKSVGLLGSNFNIIDSENTKIGTTDVFTSSEDLKLAILFSNQFGQGTVVMRKNALKAIGYYNPDFEIAHDYDLWTKFARITEIANLSEPLYSWRSAGLGLSTIPANTRKMEEEAQSIRLREFRYFIKHRNRYSIFHFRPTSTRIGWRRYLHMKNTLFRNMALLYATQGMRRHSLLPLFIAVLCEPTNTKTYSQCLATILFKKRLQYLQCETI